MYESEANSLAIESCDLPEEIVAKFREYRATIVKRTLIPWGEHCTECAWPTCYSTCDLYVPRSRADERCRRFVHGMVRMECPGTVNGHLIKISFRRWATLWSMGNVRLYSLKQADRREEGDFQWARAIGFVPLERLRGTAMQKRYSWKKRMVRRPAGGTERPDYMLVECYNPGSEVLSLTLTIRNEGDALVPFQALLRMEPGFNRHRLTFSEIAQKVNVAAEFKLEIATNEIAEGSTLIFGALDFVTVKATTGAPVTQAPKIDRAEKAAKLCKCVVWDLDNTLWDGILVEDGRERLRLKPGIGELLKTLDERGILISAVSKNNPEEAMVALESFGLAEYFLCPEISWNPKSRGIQQIATKLNIGIDSLLFVDDSVFEREEVKLTCPDVMVLDAVEYLTIPDRPECQAAVTEESRKRRLLYREQETRTVALESFEGDYAGFLRDCGLLLTVRSMTEDVLERAHELTQRTNQMNFSGNRYTREQLQAILADPNIDTFVLDCSDRFGAYGTVGFCTIQRPDNRMTDLMFSCRVQAKRVEHAFVHYILHKYRELNPGDFFVNYRKTKKNYVPGKVFEELGFIVTGEMNGVCQLKYPRDKEIRDEGIVTIVDMTRTTKNPSVAI